MELGGHMHPLLLGRLHGPVEHPPALTLSPLDPTHEPGSSSPAIDGCSPAAPSSR